MAEHLPDQPRAESAEPRAADRSPVPSDGVPAAAGRGPVPEESGESEPLPVIPPWFEEGVTAGELGYRAGASATADSIPESRGAAVELVQDLLRATPGVDPSTIEIGRIATLPAAGKPGRWTAYATAAAKAAEE